MRRKTRIGGIVEHTTKFFDETTSIIKKLIGKTMDPPTLNYNNEQLNTQLKVDCILYLQVSSERPKFGIG